MKVQRNSDNYKKKFIKNTSLLITCGKIFTLLLQENMSTRIKNESIITGAGF